MAQHESPCTKYIYGPIEGDYERWIPPGTPFEDLPEEWTCPLCDAEKEFFEELDD
ncbi:MAG: rubredoxin [Desulfobulbaceae bacterium]|nr:rubredoxin [Desulfobulbaceae bacterium]